MADVFVWKPVSETGSVLRSTGPDTVGTWYLPTDDQLLKVDNTGGTSFRLEVAVPDLSTTAEVSFASTRSPRNSFQICGGHLVDFFHSNQILE